MEKIDNIISQLPIWDKVDALEYLGVKLDLTDEEQIEIAGEKARTEKKEEIKSEKENKVRAKEFMDNMVKGMDFKESWENLFKIRK